MYYLFIPLAFLIVFSAFFSSADMAYGVVNKLRLKKEAENGSKVAKIAYNFAENYNATISTILFGNNLVNIAASSVATLIGVYVAGENGALASTFILLVALLIFAEFLPKVFAKQYSYRLSLLFAYPMVVFKYLFFVIVWPVSKLVTFVTNALTKKSKENDEPISDDELQEMVDTIEEEGIIEEDKAELLRSAIQFVDTQAFEIMTPRVDVIAFDIDDDFGEFIKDSSIFTYSRIPVYKNTIDDIIGFISTKELLKTLLKKEPVDVKSLIKQPLFIPRSTMISDLLSEFKTTHVHIAIVKDEYGGTEGLITMEDILEELVGDIFDETDVVNEEVVEVKENVYIVDGSMNLDDFFELVDYADEFETDYTTVGGFCQQILGRFAKRGDRFDFANLHIIVLKADDFTVEKIKAIIDKKTEDDE